MLARRRSAPGENYAWRFGVLRAGLAGAGLVLVVALLVSRQAAPAPEIDEMTVADSVIQLSLDL